MTPGKARGKARTDSRERLSREKGTIFKDWGGRLPIALVYPNSYYLGMSNLGIHAIYHLLNSYPDIVCERVFREDSPQIQPPVSVESRRPLTDFPVIAFSISYELDYFNVVQMLQASKIPPYATDRTEKHPLIIAGGPCITANPLPLAPFFDCLAIGEAEAIIPRLLPVLSEGSGNNRQEFLKSLSRLPGIYVPLHPREKITRQWLPNLDDFPATSAIITPDTELGNLYMIEVERGCGHGCRFCLVHTTFSPMRFRSLEKLTEQAEGGLKFGKRIGLVGPAVSEHPEIEDLLKNMDKMGAGYAISSLRIGPRTRKILPLLAKGGARTITLAPEAGSPGLRQAINKNITEEDILQTIAAAAELKIPQIKLYFMIGLPSETDEDIEATIKLLLQAKAIIDSAPGGTRLAVNFAPFVPKAGTPFQWLPIASLPTLKSRLTTLQRHLSPKGIQVKQGSPAWSQVQGVLSRGGAEVAPVLADMTEMSLSNWRKTAEKHSLDLDYYEQQWESTQKLPWDFIDLGTK
ncbi:radical SAM protein [Chloroflexota bacterium]